MPALTKISGIDYTPSSNNYLEREKAVAAPDVVNSATGIQEKLDKYTQADTQSDNNANQDYKNALVDKKADKQKPEEKSTREENAVKDTEEKSENNNPSETEQLSEEEQQQVKDLKQRDSEVRRHEQAHLAAGGGLVSGGAKFSYQTGPDNKQYAVGGEVSIDVSPVGGDPQATIRKMQQVRSAALAPAQPSGQDRSVAASASRNEAKARRELTKQRAEESQEKLNQNDSKVANYKKNENMDRTEKGSLVDKYDENKNGSADTKDNKQPAIADFIGKTEKASPNIQAPRKLDGVFNGGSVNEKLEEKISNNYVSALV